MPRINSPSELEELRQEIRELKEPSERPRLML